MDAYEKYLKYSLQFLSYRQRSEKEMRDKLVEKEAPVEVIERIITFLLGHKFLNDEDFAKSWVQSRMHFRMKSTRVVKMELLRKGIDPDTIEKALQGDEENEGMHDMDLAIKLVQKRIHKYTGMEKQEIYEKLGGYLGRRGFSWEVIKRSIDAVMKLEYNS